MRVDRRKSLATLAGCIPMVALLGGLAGCAGDDASDPCSLAQDHVAQCSAGATLPSCSPEMADKILSTSCEDIAKAIATRHTTASGGECSWWDSLWGRCEDPELDDLDRRLKAEEENIHAQASCGSYCFDTYSDPKDWKKQSDCLMSCM